MNSRTSLLYRVIAFFCILISTILIYQFNTVLDWLIDYSANQILEPEEIINPRRIAILKIGLILTISLTFCLAIILFMNLHQKLFSLINKIFDTDRMSGILFIDEQISNIKFTKRAFIFSTIFALIIHLRQLIFGDDLKEDIFEHLSEFFFIVSALLFFIIPFYIQSLEISKKNKKLIKYSALLFGLGLIFIFLEEISYGQHLFKWESSGLFETYNFQKETNLHNFINPFFRFIYPLFGFGLFAFCCVLWFFYKGEKPKIIELLTPHKSLVVYTFFMAASTYKGHSESFEHLLAVFIFLYVLRLLLCLKKLKKETVL